MTRRVIFLNGPPRSGKDTIARGMMDFLGHDKTVATKFTEPMDSMVKVMLSMNDKEFKHYREEAKDKPLPKPFHNLTMRQLLIKVSEEWIKPTWGDRYLGHVMVRRLNSLMSPTVIITDSGFLSEAMPVLSQWGLDRCLLVQVHRVGCTFDGDSRSYWELPDLTMVNLNNRYHKDNEKDLFELQIQRLLDGWNAPN